VVIVDDHLALRSVAGSAPDLGTSGPVVTTYSFQYRMARAVSDSARSGSLSRRLPDPASAVGRVLNPPAHRLLILDPRSSIAEAIRIVTSYRANLLLAELVGAALHHRAAIRVTPGNAGRSWAEIMEAEGVDFATLEP